MKFTRLRRQERKSHIVHVIFAPMIHSRRVYTSAPLGRLEWLYVGLSGAPVTANRFYTIL
jgi:hypothetical protein